jgi:hypothetical protein
MNHQAEPREGLREFLGRKRDIFLTGRLVVENLISVKKMHGTYDKEEQQCQFCNFSVCFIFCLERS